MVLKSLIPEGHFSNLSYPSLQGEKKSDKYTHLVLFIKLAIKER